MGTIFIDTLRVLTRQRALFVWALAFPLILSTVFMFMFSGLDEAVSFEAVPAAVVADDTWEKSPFSEVVEGLSAAGDDPLLDVRSFPDAEAARAALLAGEVAGVFSVSGEGSPALLLAPSVATEGSVGLDNVNRTILENVADTYVRDRDLIAGLAAEDPTVLADPSLIEAALSGSGGTEQVSLTRTSPKETVRYYYALFGMAALFGAQIAVSAVCQAQPNLSPLGARRALGCVRRSRVLAAAMAASWLLSFACLLVAFAYVRGVVGGDFGGREGWCVAGLAAAALVACALGCALGAVPKLDFGAKSGILTGIVCTLSLFAGLYGQPCMALADDIAQRWPALAALNPAKVICDMFYSLYYYDGLEVFAAKVATLAAMAAALFAVAALLMRRQRYASL